MDWEEGLSHFVGDVIANRLMKSVRAFHRHSCSAAQRFEKNVTQYLQEEAALLPCREALEDFYNDVSQLHARIHQLERCLNKIDHDT